MNKRFWQAFTALREHSCVGYAKLASIRGLSSVDLIVIKATTPDDLPLPERYVRQLLSIVSVSPPSSQAFFLSFTHRFGTTRSWRVALKCLLLLHRLLRSVPENSRFRAELIWSRENGLISLYPCRFRDYSSFYSHDYTNFIISYARFLDETISCFFLDYIAEKHEEETKDVNGSIIDVMKEVGESIELLPQIQSLIDRVMDCRPVGLAARSFLVKSSMKHIIRESFDCHTRFHKDIVLVLDNLLRIPHGSSIAAFDIYKKAAMQESQLSEFYDWCKTKRVCGSYEYPLLDRIPQMQVRSLQVLLAGMWQFSESSSSENMFSSSKSSQLSLIEDEDRDRLVTQMETITSTQWEIFEDSEFQMKLGEEKEDLIQLEVSEDMEWEALLEASAKSSHHSRNLSACEEHDYNGSEAMKLQLYNPYSLNPFNQPCYMLDFDYHNTILAQIEKPPMAVRHN